MSHVNAQKVTPAEKEFNNQVDSVQSQQPLVPAIPLIAQ